MDKLAVVLYKPTGENLVQRKDSKESMKDTTEKSSSIPYKPTEEELAKGEPNDYENIMDFPWTSFEAYLEYGYKQRLNYPSNDKLISTLKNTNFTNYDSLTKFSDFMERYYQAPHIPFGTYKSRAYGISFYANIYETADSEFELETDERNAVVEPGKDYRARYLMRLDILHSAANPVPVFSAPIIPFGTLVPMDDNSAEPDQLFRLVINAIDSSLWLVFEFKRYTDVGCDKYIIGEGDEWGKLAPDDVPFTAARIAESVADSGIGKADWQIPLPPESRICGGPGTVRVYEVDDDFLQKTIPAPSADCTPSQPPKKLNVEPGPHLLP